jgi:hypothetical protein
MKDFMFIFRGPLSNAEAFAKQSPEQMQAELAKWGAWMGSLAQQGKLAGGEALQPLGKVVHGTKRKITDGPYIEGKDIVGSYLLVKANDIDEAIELSKGCPAIETDADSIEVREIMPTQQG